MKYVKLSALIFTVFISNTATAQQFRTFQSKAYGYNFAMPKEYRLMGDTLKPNYQDLNFANGAKVNVRVTAVFTDTYDSATYVNALSKLAALKPAEWDVKLQTTYAGAKFKSFMRVKVSKHPGYRVNFETGKDKATVTHYIVNVYAKYYAYSLHMAHTDKALPAAMAKDAADFTHFLDYFSISKPTKITSQKAF